MSYNVSTGIPSLNIDDIGLGNIAFKINEYPKIVFSTSISVKVVNKKNIYQTIF